jgi:hypothetical protein
MLLLATLFAFAGDGELYLGPAGWDAAIVKAADTSPQPYGLPTATTAEALFDRADTFLTTPYVYVSGGFTYSFSDQPPKPHSDNHPYWTGMFQSRKDSLTTRIELHTFTWMMTGDEDHLDAATDIALNLAAWPRWNDPDYTCGAPDACLDNAHATESLVFFYDAARTTLDPIDREIILEAIIEKGLEPLDLAMPHHLSGPPPHNIFVIEASALVIGAAVLLDEDPRAQEWLDDGLALIDYWKAGQPVDGLAEFHGYGHYAVLHTLKAFEAMAKLGITVDEPELYDNLSGFFWGASAPIPSDELGTYGDILTYTGIGAMTIMASRGDAVAQRFLVDTAPPFQEQVPEWFDFDPSMKPGDGPDGLTTSWELGFASLRADDGTLVTFKSGPEYIDMASHNQRDHLSFRMWANGDWLNGDAGYSTGSQSDQTYNYYEGPDGHSGILVDGIGPQSRIGARLTAAEHVPGGGVVCGDASPTLPTGWATTTRCLLMHPAGFVAAMDAVTSIQPRRVDLLFQPHRTGMAATSTHGGELRRGGKSLSIRASSGDVGLVDMANTSEFGETLNVLVEPSTSQKKVSNGGFEKGTYAGFAPRVPTSQYHGVTHITAHSGNYSAFIALPTSTSGYFYSDYIDVTPGDRLRAEAWVRVAEAQGSGAAVRLLWFDDSSYLSVTEGEKVAGTLDWHLRAVAGTVPPNATRLRIDLNLQGKGGAWFDDVKLSAYNGDDDLATDIQHTTLMFPSGHILGNGDMDEDMVAWRPRYPTKSAHTVDDGEYHNASPSLSIDFPSAASSGYYYSDAMYVAPGEELSSTVWVKNKHVSGDGARLRFLFFDADGYHSSIETSRVGTTGGWTELALEGIAPQEVREVMVSLEYKGRGHVWFDDATLEIAGRDPGRVVPPGPMYGDGAVSWFDVDGTTGLLMNAERAVAKAKTPIGHVSLDAGFAAHYDDVTIMMGGSLLSIGDLSIALDDEANLRMDRDGDVLSVYMEPEVGLTLSSPDTVTVKLNGRTLWTQSSGNGVVACSGPTLDPACDQVVASLEAGSVQMAAGGITTLTAKAFDQYGQPMVTAFTWSSKTGSVAGNQFTAPTVAAYYPNALTVEGSTELLRVYLTVTAAAAADLWVPSFGAVEVGTPFTLSATVEDGFGNPTNDLIVLDVMDGATHLEGLSLVAAELAGSYPGALVLSAGSLEVEVDLELLPGPTATAEISPDTVSIFQNDEATFSTSAWDQFGNVTTAEAEWSLADAALGDIDEGVLFASTAVGSWPAGIVAVVDGVTATAAVDVAPILSELVLTPAVLFLSPSESVELDVHGLDPWDGVHEVTLDAFELDVAAGSLLDFTLTADTVAGSYPAALTATAGSITSSWDVVLIPGPAATLGLSAPATATAGELFRVTWTAEDAFGNPVDEEPTWSGDFTELADGWYEASTVASKYPNAVVAQLHDAEATASVQVDAGVPARIELSPDAFVVDAGAQQNLVADVVDAFGNPVTLDVVWSADAGTILDGLFTAGTVPGEWYSGVTATVDNVQASAHVVVNTSLDHLDIQIDATTVLPEDELPLTAQGFDAYGNLVATTVSWSASDGEISSAGPWKAPTTPGLVSIIAESDGVTATHRVDVMAGPAAHIAVQDITAAQGATISLEAVVTDAWGNSATERPDWTAGAGIAELGEGWAVVGDNRGTFGEALTATIGGVSASITLTVVEAELSDTDTDATDSVDTTNPLSMADVGSGVCGHTRGAGLLLVLISAMGVRRKRTSDVVASETSSH